MSTILTKSPETGHVRILTRSLGSIRQSPENAKLYHPVDPADPEIVALADSIRLHGVQEPLVITRDGWIISGHRRYVAARLTDSKVVPCVVKPILKDRDHDEFMTLLREYNRQRVKSFSEKLREEILSANPSEAYASLIEHRQQRAEISIDGLNIYGEKTRAKISKAKAPMMAAIHSILRSRRKFWPLSDRQIHYALLNDPPLIHASKPDSTYSNTPKAYKSLTELLTRARLEELIPMTVIADETRPVLLWDVHTDTYTFLRNQLNQFLKGYYRDLMYSQSNHVEIVGEKNTISSIIQPVAADYCIPLTLGRGYCSLPPRYGMVKRHKKSGKDKFILLVLSDFDPDGEEIAHSLARSIRDDFSIKNIEPIKVAITADQVQKFNLPIGGRVKKGANESQKTKVRKFAEKYGENVFELEAMAPTVLQDLLRKAIDSVIDIEAFSAEIEQEKEDAKMVEGTRHVAHEMLRELEIEDFSDGPERNGMKDDEDV